MSLPTKGFEIRETVTAEAKVLGNGMIDLA